jgi:hypothetical protein
MKTLACCRRRPQDFSIDMDQDPDSKEKTPSLPTRSSLPPWFSLSSCISAAQAYGALVISRWAVQPAPYLGSLL